MEEVYGQFGQDGQHNYRVASVRHKQHHTHSDGQSMRRDEGENDDEMRSKSFVWTDGNHLIPMQIRCTLKEGDECASGWRMDTTE